MLLQIKLAETQQHLQYVASEFSRISVSTYPNMEHRLHLRLQEMSLLNRELQELEKLVNNYVALSSAQLDPWRQIYGRLVAIAAQVLACRVRELPIYLKLDSDDHLFSNLLSAIHTEIGLATVQPTVSLHHGMWFAVARNIPTFALYLLPSSIKQDINELPLIFHEIGHTLFRLGGASFTQPLEAVIQSHFQRKRQEAAQFSDPSVRTHFLGHLQWLQAQLFEEMEETVCDIIGGLLGGPAYFVALAVGLWTSSYEPFKHNSPKYPPLDCRMRLSKIVLGHIDASKEIEDAVEATWIKVRSLFNLPPWYNWFYDDMYFTELTSTVADLLSKSGLTLFGSNAGELRQTLYEGTIYRIQDSRKHKDWLSSTMSQWQGEFHP